MGKIKDITNQRFGKLVAIRNTGKRDKGRNLIWECQCDCGNICEVSGNNLRTGHTRSCGCQRVEAGKKVGKLPKFIDETNNIYGKLKVIDLAYIQKYDSGSNAYWNCKCECGNHIVVAGNHLRSGHTQSCGCIKSQGELIINNLLSLNNIHYMTQYTVNINGSYYRFDFAILDDNNNILRLLEYDGEQHFPEYDSELYPYHETHRRDIIKNKYCLDNNIPLYRIPYWEKTSITIEKLLDETYRLNI